MTIETEIWRTPIGKGEIYDNYQVSNLGNVMSLNYNRTGKPKLMKTSKTTDGYLRVCLYKNGKNKNFSVHRLVAETFIPNPNNLPEVNHKDENKENNFVGTPENDYKDGNLEWCTREYNMNYGTCIERMVKTNSKVQINGKKSKIVLQFTLDGILVKEWPSTRECGRNNFHQGAVAACCRGEKLHYKGYIWKYKE